MQDLGRALLDVCIVTIAIVSMAMVRTAAGREWPGEAQGAYDSLGPRRAASKRLTSPSLGLGLGQQGQQARCRVNIGFVGAPSAAAKAFERLPTLAAVTSSVGGAGQVPASRLRMSSRALFDLTGGAMNEGRPERMVHVAGCAFW